jgi:hypothetical protein
MGFQMSNTDENVNPIDFLLQFLDRVDPEGRQKVGRELAKAGIVAGTQTASTDAIDQSLPSAADAAEAMKKKNLALIGLAVTSLTNVVDRFAPLRDAIQVRVRKIRRLKLASAIITMVLSSSVIASLQAGDNKSLAFGLGLATLLASLLTLIATWMEGESRFSEELGEVNSKCATATQLRDRLNVYGKSPELFDDLKDRLTEATELIEYLEQKVARWNVAIKV